jgi:hypothetical protein
MARHEVTTRRVLYEIPGMQSIHARKSNFNGAGGEVLPLEIYDAVNPISDAVVVIIEGYPDAGFEKHVGCKFMEMEWTIAMARLIAASGITAITHSNRDPEADANALLAHLSARTPRIGIWSTSGHGPVALKAAAKAKCTVLANPVTAETCPDTPLFIVRSGKDETPGLNLALDAFMTRAVADNKPITLVNYPEAPHAFDIHLDHSETRRILQQGLDFLRAHLM